MTAATREANANARTSSAAQAGAGLSVDELSDLMKVVNTTTAQLQETHHALHAEVARLQAELREANAQLRRSRSLAALGEMAAGIAHEVRTPLASIRLYAQMLADDCADRPEQATVCEKINRSVVMLDAVVRDVLLFARDMRVRPQPLTAGGVIDAALHACESLLSGGAVEVQRAGAALDATFEADPVLLNQALGNVIRNAIEAMVEAEVNRPRLVVAADRREVRCADGRRQPRLVLEVTDNGPGVPADVIERMFNPFFTTRCTGTGLGLAIVNRIVEAHGGLVSVANEPGSGATVALCLPRRPTVQQTHAPPDVQTHDAGEHFMRKQAS